eukprot:3299-Heterococcus_DN1.PRE.1
MQSQHGQAVSMQLAQYFVADRKQKSVVADPTSRKLELLDRPRPLARNCNTSMLLKRTLCKVD